MTMHDTHGHDTHGHDAHGHDARDAVDAAARVPVPPSGTTWPDQFQPLMLSAIESIDQGINLLDAELRFVGFNQRFARLLDIPDGAFQPGDSYERYLRFNAERGEYGAGDTDELIEQRLEVLRTGAPSLVERERPNGQALEIRITPLPDGSFALLYTDITERREREKALRQSEERFFRAFDLSPSIKSISSAAHSRVYNVNEAWVRTMGFSRHEVIGQMVEEVGTWVDPEKRGEIIAALRAGKAVRDWELQLRTKKGKILDFLVAAALIDVDDEECLMFVALDITDRKDTERALKQSEELFRNAFEYAGIAVSMADSEGKFINVNPAYCELFGYTAEEMRGKTIAEVTYPDDVGAESLRQYQRLMNGEIKAIRTEKRYVRKDGSVIWGALNCTMVRDTEGNPLHAIAQIQDITAAKDTMAELAESEQRFRDFTELASDWTWETGEDLRFTKFSEEQRGRIREVTGVDSDDMIGTTRWSLVSMDPDTDEVWRQHLADLSARRPYQDFRWEFRTADDRVVHLRASGRPMFDEEGGFKGYRGVTHDETPIVEARQRAEDAEALLTDAVESLPVGFAVFDPDDRLASFNRKFLETYWDDPDIVRLGDTFENLCRTVANLGHFPDALGREEEWLADRMQKHRDCSGAYEQEIQDGRWLQIAEYPTSKGGRVGVRTDITELKKREFALARSQQRFRDFAETASDWLWEMDRDLRFTDFSEGMPARTGFPVEAIAGKTRWELVGVDPDQDDKWRQHRDDLLAHREFRDFRFFVADGNGEMRHLRLSGRPIFDEAGEFAGYRGTGVNETAQIEAAERAQAAERRFSEAIESMDGAFAYFDADDRLVRFNQEYVNLFAGIADKMVPGVTFEELVRTWAEGGFVEGAKGRVEEWVAERVRQHHSAAKNIDEVMTDGRWLRYTEYGTHDGGMIAFRTDVTELKRQEQELALKSSQLQNTLEYMDQGISMVDADLNVILFNQRFLDLLDFPPGAFMPGDTFEKFLRFNATRGEYGDGAIDDLVNQRLQMAREFVPHVFERERPDGSVLEIRGAPVPEGGFVTVYTDITERTRADRERRETQDRLNTVLANIPIIIWAVSRDGHLTLSEGKGLESLGIPPRRGVGRPIYRLFRKRPDILSSVERALEGEAHTQIFKMRDRLFETVFTCLHDEAGELTGVLGTSIDVTERHEAQTQLVQAAKLATLGEMATSVAHEINQPLNVIRIASESAIEELEPENVGDLDTEFLHSKIAQVIKQTERAASIVDHMRIFGRRSEGEATPFDPCASVQDALGLVNERFRIHSVGLNTHVPESCRQVMGDQLQLEQVILNILGNAFDAMEESDRNDGNGSGSGNAVSVVVDDDAGHDRVRIVCEDTGGGIPDYVLPRIFEPFFTTK